MNVFLYILAMLVSVYFTYKASGTLNPTKINLPMGTMYLFYLQQCLGGLLIATGHLGHYLYTFVYDKSTYTSDALYAIALVAVLLPLTIYLFNRLFKNNAKESQAKYMESETLVANKDNLSFYLILGASILALIFLVLYLAQIGFIPLLELINPNSTLNFNKARIDINAIEIIHPIFTNIVILTGIPVLSYLTFAKALASRKWKWWILFAVMFIASAITKTYNFEKSPIVFHLAIFVLIFIYFSGGIKWKYLFIFVAIAAVIILAFYYITFNGVIHYFNMYQGPFARAVLTPVGVIAMSFDLFPKYIPFLSGRSLPGSLIWMAGFDGGERVRSARILMEFYGSESVYHDTAGVFNTLFIGEAYANWGYWGMLFSIIWVGFILALFFAIFMKTKKTAANIAANAYFTMTLAQASQGGFVDFLFNGTWIVVVIGFAIMHYINLKEIEKSGNVPKINGFWNKKSKVALEEDEE